MKQALDSYINSMTSTDMNTLEEIILKKYKKLKGLYKLIKEYSDNIKKIKYTSSDDYNTLEVVLILDKKIANEIDDTIQSNISGDMNIDTDVIDAKNIHIVVTLCE